MRMLRCLATCDTIWCVSETSQCVKMDERNGNPTFWNLWANDTRYISRKNDGWCVGCLFSACQRKRSKERCSKSSCAFREHCLRKSHRHYVDQHPWYWILLCLVLCRCRMCWKTNLSRRLCDWKVFDARNTTRSDFATTTVNKSAQNFHQNGL